MIDSVLLELIRVGAKVLVIGQQIFSDGAGAVRHQSIRRRVDGQLQPRVAQRRLDGF